MPTAAYDAIAEWYDQSIRQGTLLAAEALIASACFQALGSLQGQIICDLACGQGDLARQIARRGGRVVGIDISAKLLDIARREEQAEPLGITYYQADAQALPDVAEGPFDGVLCSMALMDIPDLGAVCDGVRRLLKSEGWFVATITHPCFQSPPGRGYQDEGFWRSDNPNGVRGRVGAYHRTLSTYLSAFGAAGLWVERVAEPHLPGRDEPPVLIVQCRRVFQER